MYQCKVWLDNYTGQYFPGSVIQGKVVCNFDSETTFRAIKIRIKGEEHTEWMGTETYFDSTENKETTRQVLFSGNNEFLSNEILLHGQGGNTTTLPAGQHYYPFSYQLPATLPGSYSCQYGYIMFKIVAIVDRPLRQDYEDTAMFNVASPIDLNKLGQEILQPASFSEDTTICCFCCASGPISMDAELSKQAAVPGESLNLSIRISNLSNVNVEGVSVQLKQKFIYTVNTPSSENQYDESTLLDINNVGVGAHGEHTYELKLDVPNNIIVPNFELCSLFTVNYILLLKAQLPSCHQDIELEIRPKIGNIAIGHSFDMSGGGNTQNPGFIQPSGPYPQPPTNGNYGPYPGGDQGQSPYPSGGGQAPFAGGQPPYMGGPSPYQGGYPPSGGQPPYSAGQYSPYPSGSQYPPPNMAYPPPGGYPSAPTAPADGKAQEASQTNRPGGPSQEQPPPSYDSLNLH